MLSKTNQTLLYPSFTKLHSVFQLAKSETLPPAPDCSENPFADFSSTKEIAPQNRQAQP
jgi:hypothetical protein